MTLDVVRIFSPCIEVGLHCAKAAVVINPQNKAEIRMLKLGMTSNGQIEVLDGLKGSEKVVLEGIDRLSEGKEVQIVAENQQPISTAKPTAG